MHEFCRILTLGIYDCTVLWTGFQKQGLLLLEMDRTGNPFNVHDYELNSTLEEYLYLLLDGSD